MSTDKKQELHIIVILAVYSLVFFVFLGVWNFTTPTAAPPLPIYWLSWPITGGISSFIQLFPALLFSAIASSFAFTIIGEFEQSRFSPQFLSRMAKPLITIIVATAVYGILLLLIQPLINDSRYRMQTQGQLFKEAKEKAADEIAREDWKEAALHLALCERIWSQSTETEKLRNQLAIAQDKERAKRISIEHPPTEKGYIETPEGVIPLLPGLQGPVTIREALTLAERNLARENNFDAHWYAMLAKKLTKPGSPEELEATRLAAQAWNGIADLRPTPSEKNAYRIFKEKEEGYNAILSKDWVRAYYIFNSLSKEVPSDPDVKRYLENALAGTKQVAFFQEEAEKAVGETLSYGLFTIPVLSSQGETGELAILRIESLTLLSDAAYGVNVQYQSKRLDGTVLSSVQSDYAKFTPFSGNSEQTGKPKTLMILKAIDRNLNTKSWDPVWTKPSKNKEPYLVLDLSFDDFLLASHAQTNNRNLSILELLQAQSTLPSYGFISQTFQLELLNRIMDPFLCLVLGIFVLTLSWRLRPHKKPGLIAFPMFLILPLVSFLLIEGSRITGTIINTALLIHFSFPITVVISIVNQMILTFLAILFLAGQRN